MTTLTKRAMLLATAMMAGLANAPAHAALLIPFTFSATNGLASTSGSGSFTTKINSGTTAISDLSAFTLTGSANALGLFGGSYAFSGLGDLSSFSATLGSGGFSSLAFTTVSRSFDIFFVLDPFTPIATADVAFAVNGLAPGNLTVTSPLPDATGTLSFGTVSAVPEPATWALMIGGLGLVGATLRRNKVALRPAVA